MLMSCTNPPREPSGDFSFPDVPQDTSSVVTDPVNDNPPIQNPIQAVEEEIIEEDTSNYSIRIVSDVSYPHEAEVYVPPSKKFIIDIYSSQHIIQKLHEYFISSEVYDKDDTLMKAVVEKLWWHYYLRSAMTNNNQLDPKAAEIAAQTLVDFPLNVWAEYKTLVHNRKLEEDKRIADSIVSEWSVTKVVDKNSRSITYRIVKRNGR